MSSMDTRPTVTVIMVCYREKALLYRAMASLDAQTDKQFDIVLVNDASTCIETNRICHEFSGRANVHLIMRKHNGGLSATRNDGFAAASGVLCMPLDGDDELPDRAVELVRSCARRNPDADFIFGNYVRSDVERGESELVDCRHLVDGTGWMDPRMLATYWRLMGQSPCFKSTWERIGGYHDRYSYDYPDTDFWMRAVGAGMRGVYVPETIYLWHRSESGMNAATKLHRFWDVTVRNRRFQQVCGDWDTVREGFLGYVINNSVTPDARALMRREGWRVLPSKRREWPLYLRAWFRAVLPNRVTKGIVGCKGRLRSRAE